MACLVCSHPKRFRIEAALRDKKPKSVVARDFGLVRSTLQLHIKEKHEEKDPAKEPTNPEPDPADPFPNDHQIKEMRSRAERLRHVDRLLASRMFKGSETIAKLARLWRHILGADAEMHVAGLVAESARKHRIGRGPKDVRKELLIVKTLDLYEKCYNSGDYKTCSTLINQLAELDGLKDDPSSYKAVLVQIVQLIKHEAPFMEQRVNEHLAKFEIVVDQAKAVLDGEVPPQMPLLSDHVPDSPPTPRSIESGIDTGIPRSEEPSSE